MTDTTMWATLNQHFEINAAENNYRGQIQRSLKIKDKALGVLNIIARNIERKQNRGEQLTDLECSIKSQVLGLLKFYRLYEGEKEV